MSGLCGIITQRPPDQAAAQLERMSRALHQEPFYSHGTWMEKDLGIYCAWTTLQGSFSDCLPIWNEKKDVMLLFVGDHIADKEEVVELKRRNHMVRKADASYLVHLYEEKGGAAFARALNGNFYGLLIDFRTRRGLLFNDRLGIGRLFVHEDGSSFYFSSQLPAILAACPESREVSPEAAATLLRHGALPDEQRLFPRTNVLPAASSWALEDGAVVSRDSYFNAEDWADQTYVGRDYFCEKFKELLARIVPRYLKREQGIALLLTHGSGGRLLLASAEFPRGDVPCFLTHQDESGERTNAARKLAAAAGQDLQVLAAETATIEDLLFRLKLVVQMSGEADDTTNPDVVSIAKAGRGIAPTVLSSLFFNETLHPAEVSASSSLEPGANGKGNQPHFRQIPSRTPPPLRRLRGALAGSFGALQSQLEVRCPFLDLELLSLLYRIPPGERYEAAAVHFVLRASGDAVRKEAATARSSSKQLDSLATIKHRFDTALSALRSDRVSVEREQALPAGHWLHRSALFKTTPGAAALREILTGPQSHTLALLPEAAAEALESHFDRGVDRSLTLGRILKLELLLQQALHA